MIKPYNLIHRSVQYLITTYGKLVGNGMVWKPLVVAMVGIWYKICEIYCIEYAIVLNYMLEIATPDPYPDKYPGKNQ